MISVEKLNRKRRLPEISDSEQETRIDTDSQFPSKYKTSHNK